MCIRDGCRASPVYGKRGDSVASFCSRHRGEQMFNLVSRKCLHEFCVKTPNFNLEGGKPLFCNDHKTSEMVNTTKYKKCMHGICKFRASFNFKGLNPTVCSSHKETGMVDLIKAKCIHELCGKRPNFNVEGANPLYCFDHMEVGMVCKSYRSCKFGTCKTTPCFNYLGLKPDYCAIHREPGMMNVCQKLCIHESCTKPPNFNFSGLKPLVCSLHKEVGMISMINNKRCNNNLCNKIPVYNVFGETRGIVCGDHKEDGMINVVGTTCSNEFCNTRVTRKKYEGLCLRCFIYMFPDKPVAKNYRTKEYSVVEYIKSKYQDLTWVTDKKVEGGCSLRRPDLLLDLGYQILIIEIDENQHLGYDTSCEHRRIMEISRDSSHRPIVFIRFNPDNYNIRGKNITSCWGPNGNGICTVKESKKKEWTHRLESLETQIQYWIQPENKTDKTVEIVELFYDIV